MLYRIIFLKAPWPAGAKVGDVLELASVPAWALGKCEPAGDDAVATVGADEPEGSDAPPAADREAMEAEAKALGVGFNARTSDETLAARIAEAKAGK